MLSNPLFLVCYLAAGVSHMLIFLLIALKTPPGQRPPLLLFPLFLVGWPAILPSFLVIAFLDTWGDRDL